MCADSGCPRELFPRRGLNISGASERSLSWNPRPSRPPPRPLLLFPCIDRPWPNGANARDRLLGVDARFGQQSRRDHARASEAATTMNEDVFARIETRSKVTADLQPFGLELRTRRAHIADGQVQPFHPPTLNF